MFRNDKDIKKILDISLYGVLLPPFLLIIYTSIFKNNFNILLFGSGFTFITSYLIFNYNKPLSKNKVDTSEAILYTLIAAMSMIAINILLNYIMSPQQSQESKDIIMNLPKWMAVLLSVIIAPVSEELFFRQGVYNLIGDNKLVYILFSSALFALAHIQAGDTLTLIYILANSFIFGFILSTIHYKTKNIFIPILAHALVNLIAILL